MGSLYLLDLAAVCRSTGYPVIEVEGWTSRARGSGGYVPGALSHLMLHHTASGSGSDGWDDVNYLCYGDDDAPLANLYLSRLGELFVCAAGATNTNGSGQDPCGHIADDTMNTSAVGVEAGNAGTGEPWSVVQQNAYIALCAALCAAYAIPHGRCHSHAEYAVGRKIDPAGPSRWADDGTWEMDAFRGELEGEEPPIPAPTPPEEDDVKLTLLRSPDEPFVFAWDGLRIGWVRSELQAGLYGTTPVTTLGHSELQMMIDNGWVGGHVPDGYRDPPEPRYSTWD